MSEENSEWEYRFRERLGILIDGPRVPNKHEVEMARDEAFAAIEKLESSEQTEEEKFDLF